ncbi:acyl-CoA dehydrogenase family protein [Sporosarcina sp. P33]|uniref:acyl-CoA dehydrogenase family protein n=1 Tax=Sporosarcina sp. P33 TaxID=1930764 RepID=UPI0009C037C2|nr:acyl-CoA dehydrogenase family protein [Sporosarcina sp. P33]ARD47060.1 acyl-CoA dehydrogenase [Sporosarcina sp. P33]
MDFSYTVEEEAFRTELRSWLEENLPDGWLEGEFKIPNDESSRIAFLREWQSKLFEGGWSGISWPAEYGGKGATLLEEVIYEQEMARVKAPPIINLVGLAMVGPTLLQMGTEYQKQRYVNKILSNKEIWCQGYSEPNAGSDLAALQTRAVKKGDKWIINGQKVWTSFAQYSDYCFLLARTDTSDKKHYGITAFIVNMHQKGVEVKPIRSINDRPAFNELFFNDAVAYDIDIVGEVNNGWSVSLALLSHERVGVARKVFRIQKVMDELIEISKKEKEDGYPLISNPIVRNKLINFKIRAKAVLLTYYRNLTETIRAGKPGPTGSVDKLLSSELLKEMYGFALSMQGPLSTLWLEDIAMKQDWQDDYLQSLGSRIAGGSSEIQKNVIAERILGLPKDIKY